LYGENIIARFEPVKNTQGAPLQIRKWWWEEAVDINETLITAIEKGMSQFSRYLGITDDSKDYMRVILNS